MKAFLFKQRHLIPSYWDDTETVVLCRDDIVDAHTAELHFHKVCPEMAARATYKIEEIDVPDPQNTDDKNPPKTDGEIPGV